MALGFPLYINLHGNNCVVLGGGEFAWERARTLLAFGAKVTVISPNLCEGCLLYTSSCVYETVVKVMARILTRM